MNDITIRIRNISVGGPARQILNEASDAIMELRGKVARTRLDELELERAVEWVADMVKAHVARRQDEKPKVELPELPPGIGCVDRGTTSEYYTKRINAIRSNIIRTEGENNWTADELEAIVRHKRLVDKAKELTQ